MKDDSYQYEITPRPDHLGGGWNLSLTHDGKNVGGGAFPVTDECDETQAWNDAMERATEWLESRSQPQGPEADHRALIIDIGLFAASLGMIYGDHVDDLHLEDLERVLRSVRVFNAPRVLFQVHEGKIIRIEPTYDDQDYKLQSHDKTNGVLIGEYCVGTFDIDTPAGDIRDRLQAENMKCSNKQTNK